MKYFFFVLCFAVQIAATAYENAEPAAQSQDTKNPKIKEVTKAAFLKQLTAIHQSAKNEVLVVSFIPHQKDPYSVEYDGTNNTDIEKSIRRLETGDRIIIEPKRKSSVETTTYILK
jgi:hypothetical protein